MKSFNHKTQSSALAKTLLMAIASASVLASMSSCTKSVQRTVHEGPKDTAMKDQSDVDASPLVTTQSDDSLQKFQGLDVKALQDQGAAAKTTSQHLEVIKQLSPALLSSAQMRRPDVVYSQKFRDLLRVLNNSIIAVSNLDAKNAELLTVLKTYQGLATEGCTASGQSCQNIRILGQDLHSSRVIYLQLLQMRDSIRGLKATQNTTQLEAEIRNYYSLIGVAYDLKLKQKDADLDFLYMVYARSYADLLIKENTPASLEELRRHGRIFQTVLQAFPTDVKNPQFQEFLIDFKPWTYSRTQSGLFPYGNRELFSAAAKVSLYEGNSRQLSKSFKEAIKTIQSQKDQFGPSFLQLVTDMKTKYSNMLGAFQVPVDQILSDSFYDEYFFMIDRMYRGHLSMEEVTELWNISGKDLSLLSSKYETYLKINLLEALLYTIEEMKKIYATNAAESDKMFEVVLQNSKYISNHWGEVLNPARQVATFVIEQISRESADSKKSFQIKSLLESVDRNAKVLSVYPNMMLMVYLMAQKDMNITYRTWWGAEIKIDPATIINELFQGNLSSWFRFGNLSNDGISKFELNHAFHYAILSGIFDAFKGQKKLDGSPVLDYSSFFGTIIRRYLNQEIEALNKALSTIAEFPANAKFQTALNFCDALSQKNDKQQISLTMDDMDTLRSYLVTGSGSEGKASITGIMQLLYDDGEFGLSTVSSMLRFSINPKLMQMRLLADVLEMNKAQLSADGQTESLIKQVREQIAEIESKKLKYYETALGLHRQVSQCQNTAMNLESDYRNRFVKLEAARLGKIYDGYSELAGKQNGLTAESLAALKKTPDFGIDEKLEDISEQGYTYNQLNFFIRAKNWLISQSPVSVDVKLPAVAFERVEAYQMRVTIPFKNSNGQLVKKSDFIKSALQWTNNSQEKTFITWTDTWTGWKSKSGKVSSLSSMYRLGLELDAKLSKRDGNKGASTQRVTADEVLSESSDLLRMAHISDADLEVMNWLSLTRKVSVDALKMFFPIDSDPQSSPLENVYLNATINGERGNDLFLLDAQAFYEYKIMSLKYIFAPPEAIDQRIRSYYVPYVQNAEWVKDDFNQAIQRLESKELPPWGAKDLVYRIENGAVAEKWTPSRVRGANGETLNLLLSRERGMDKLTNNLRGFHLRTNNFYRTADKEEQAKALKVGAEQRDANPEAAKTASTQQDGTQKQKEEKKDEKKDDKSDKKKPGETGAASGTKKG